MSSLQLAHNERHPETGNSVAKVIHSFGRAEHVDRQALGRLVSSISRFLAPEQALAAAAGVEVEVLDSRRLGGAWVLDRVWERLGTGAAVRRVAVTRGGGHYIHAEKLRHTNAEATAALARAGRYQSVAGNLRVKEVQVARAPAGVAAGVWMARRQRLGMPVGSIGPTRARSLREASSHQAGSRS